ncbi:MAG: hypothetical protein NTZ20_02950 [Candidatus Levybacteria bacterium]|nr:hypothetical protein [Candidatus Levybacteria bacterium]MSU25991.1 hypothetical protein [Candidatus Levybacteria bacterium]
MNLKWICIISGGMLLISIPSGWPYGFYQLLRIVIFLTSITVAWGFYKSNLTSWMIIFGAVAFLFNSLYPIYPNKQSWVPIDFIGAILFFLAAYSKKHS